jgi:hypothetical protein
VKDGAPVIVIVHSGGFWKYPVFDLARELGYYTVLADDEKFLADSIRDGLQSKVDLLFGVDIHDPATLVPRVEEKLRNAGIERPDGVTTFFELAVEQTARLAAHYNLSGNLVETAHRARNKFLMREAIADPFFDRAFQKVESPGQLRDFFQRLGEEPVILKPCDLAASTGVKRVRAEMDIEAAWAESSDALAKFENLYRYTSMNGLMAERMMPFLSREYNVDMFVNNGRVYVIGVAEKKDLLDGPDFQENAYVFPPYSLGVPQVEALKEESRRAARAVGVTVGAVHLEAKMIVEGGVLRPCVIELGARCGGDLEMEALREHRGNIVDLRVLVLKQAADLLTQEDLQLAKQCDEESAPRIPIGVCVKYALRAGVLKRDPDLPEAVHSFHRVIEVKFEAKTGHRVFLPQNDYLGAVMTSGDDAESALEHVEAAIRDVALDMEPISDDELVMASL